MTNTTTTPVSSIMRALDALDVDDEFDKQLFDRDYHAVLKQARRQYKKLVLEVRSAVLRLTDYRESLLGFLNEYAADPEGTAPDLGYDPETGDEILSDWATEMHTFVGDLVQERVDLNGGRYKALRFSGEDITIDNPHDAGSTDTTGDSITAEEDAVVSQVLRQQPQLMRWHSRVAIYRMIERGEINVETQP